MQFCLTKAEMHIPALKISTKIFRVLRNYYCYLNIKARHNDSEGKIKVLKILFNVERAPGKAGNKAQVNSDALKTFQLQNLHLTPSHLQLTMDHICFVQTSTLTASINSSPPCFRAHAKCLPSKYPLRARQNRKSASAATRLRARIFRKAKSEDIAGAREQIFQNPRGSAFKQTEWGFFSPPNQRQLQCD